MKEKQIPPIRFFIIGIIVVTALSCKLSTALPEGENMSNPVKANSVQKDIEGLAQLINLPVQPESVLWRITEQGSETHRTVPGPSDYTLEAIITFTPEDSRTIQAKSSAYALDWTVEWEESYFEAWYPDSIKKSFTFDTATGKYKLNGPAYNASEMFGKPPYLAGNFFITNSGELFLSLSSG